MYNTLARKSSGASSKKSFFNIIIKHQRMAIFNIILRNDQVAPFKGAVQGVWPPSLRTQRTQSF